MVFLIIALDAQNHLGSLLQRGLVHSNRLEAPLQGSVLLNILAVLLEGSGPNHLNLPPGEGGFQDVGSVHAALRVPGAHQVVNLVNKENHVPVCPDLLHQALDSALELAPELGASHQGCQIQQLDLLLLEPDRHIPLGNAQGKPLCHSGFAHAGLADQAGVVLGSAGENLHHPLNLLLPANDAVQLPGPGPGGQIRAVILDVLALLLVDILPALPHSPGREAPSHAAVLPAVRGPQHLGRQGGSPARGEIRLPFLLLLGVHAHQLGHLLCGLLKLLLRHSGGALQGVHHVVHQIIDRLDSQLFGADKAVSLHVLAVRGLGHKHCGRPLAASCTKHHH